MWLQIFFWSCLFDNIYASCILISICFFRLGNFYSIILLKTFSVPLTGMSPSSWSPIICRYGLSIVSQIAWKCLKGAAQEELKGPWVDTKILIPRDGAGLGKGAWDGTLQPDLE